MKTEAEERALTLIEAAAGGDPIAFERLYERYSAILYALLMRILSDAADAQDALQETFVQAWKGAERYDRKRGSEAAWLISIARSRGIDRLRSRKVRSQYEEDAGKEVSRGSASEVTPRPFAPMVQQEQQRAVRGALSTLPEPQRVALELAYFEGLSQSEIATRLQEPLGTVKTRMALGMKKLREQLKEMR